MAADANERLGAYLAERGQRAAALDHLKAALMVRAEMAQLEPGNLPRQAAHALALARVRKLEDARRKAEGILRRSDKRTALVVSLARSFAVCAVADSDHQVRKSDLSLAIRAIESAIGAGYHDWFALATEPDLAVLRTDPNFQSLLKQLKSVAR
jgi:hypothetical protein